MIWTIWNHLVTSIRRLRYENGSTCIIRLTNYWVIGCFTEHHAKIVVRIFEMKMAVQAVTQPIVQELLCFSLKLLVLKTIYALRILCKQNH